jgi:membrane protein YqaA with SNARE-associated domain
VSLVYFFVFLGSMAVDLIPVMAPPAWMVMTFLLMKYRLDPWMVLAVGVPGSVLGRYLFSLYIPKFSDKVITKRKNEELRWLGKKLKGRLWQTWVVVFGYSVSPLSTTVLFTAAGITKVPVWHLLPPFTAGKFISDAAMVMAGRYAATNLEGLLQGTFGLKSLLTGAVTLIVTGALLFIDWHALLVKKQLEFNFSIWR